MHKAVTDIKKILILHSALSANETRAEEQDTLLQVDVIKKTLLELNFSVHTLPFTLNLLTLKEQLEAHAPDVIFNLVESVDNGSQLTAIAPIALEQWGFAYTGCSGIAWAMSDQKLLAKQLLQSAGLPTADYMDALYIFRNPHQQLSCPYLVKSTSEHSSLGLDKSSLASDCKTLGNIISDRQQRFGGTWFAERYVHGREFNLSMLGSKKQPEIFPIAEINFDSADNNEVRIVDYAAKWDKNAESYRRILPYFPNHTADAELFNELRRLALQCWKVFDLSGYVRVDFRVDDNGQPWILEINTAPCLDPEAGFSLAAAKAGIHYPNLILKLLDIALR